MNVRELDVARLGRHRHYFRETWGGTCRCGESAGEPECGQDHRAIEAEAVAAERARITEAVRGLHDEVCGCGADGSDPDCNATWYVNWPAAVLRIVNPEEAEG